MWERTISGGTVTKLPETTSFGMPVIALFAFGTFAIFNPCIAWFPLMLSAGRCTSQIGCSALSATMASATAFPLTTILSTPRTADILFITSRKFLVALVLAASWAPPSAVAGLSG